MGKPPTILDETSKAEAVEQTSPRRSALADGDESVPYSHGQTMEAWTSFLTAQDRYCSSRPSVRGVIEQSWQRSQKAGVNARGRGSTRIMPQSELERLRLENDNLLDSARRTFQRIADTLGDAETMAIITDASGIILDVGGDRKTIDSAHDIRLEVGAAWNEAVTGTNGIGTALATRQLTHVHAAEHFCEGVKSWSCVGAPIHSPVDDSVIGIVDFSGPHEIFHRHNIALALISANYIELALIEKIRMERMQLLEASLRRIPRVGAGDTIVVVDRFGRIVHHNATASQNLNSLMNVAGSLAKGRRILDFNGVVPEGHLETSLPEELRDHDVLPLKVNGAVRGAMIVIGSKARTQPEAVSASELFSTVTPRARQQLVGRSPGLLEAIAKAERAARGQAPILLEGETGVGKTSFAHFIHAVAYPDGKAPFVAFNCGPVSGDGFDTAPLGRASFSLDAAPDDGVGSFKKADGGTLLLEEVEAIPFERQPGILRAIEERAFRRGDVTPLRALPFMLIASTTGVLRKDVSEGRFRRDLYLRIGTVKIAIPPLRDRIEDVEELLDHFNRYFAEKYDVETLRFGSNIVDMLRGYAWPGNVRELRNLVESIVLTATGRTVRPEDLSDEIRQAISIETSMGEKLGAAPEKSITSLDLNERRLIERAVDAADGNISKAAETLGVSRSTVYRKLSQYRSAS